jgi:hypothetical protein
MAVETLGEECERSGEEDRPTDALDTAGQDQHDRRLGQPAEQRTQREDDETDGEQQSPPVAISQGSGGQERGCQRQSVGIDHPLHVAEARVQLRLDGRQGNDHDRDVQEEHEGGRTHHDQGPPLLFHDQ